MTLSDSESRSKTDKTVEQPASTVLSLELRPVPHYIQTVIWFGGVILSMVLLALLFLRLGNPDLLLVLLVGSAFFALYFLEPLRPTLPGRTPRKLEVDEEEVRFLHGSLVKKSLPWARVEKIEWGAMRSPGGKRTSATGMEKQIPYIRFVGFPSLASILVTGFDFQVRPAEVEQAALAVAEVARSRSIPVEHRDIGLAARG